ncbi:MAG: hypothetical protein N2747_05275 [Chitinophagaceae bacterium]|nr:hypothetical protein [Chitinophagaceae bacterium]
MKDIHRFYKELGNLFYAIAYADGKITATERNMLHEEVKKTWLDWENSKDRFGTDRAFLIEFEFETMEDAGVKPREAYQSFADYFKDHEPEFDLHLKRKIFESSRRIAESVRKINADELDYLIRLKKLFGL